MLFCDEKPDPSSATYTNSTTAYDLHYVPEGEQLKNLYRQHGLRDRVWAVKRQTKAETQYHLQYCRVSHSRRKQRIFGESGGRLRGKPAE